MEKCILCGKRSENALCNKCYGTLNSGTDVRQMVRETIDDNQEMPSKWPTRLWMAVLVGLVILLVFLGVTQ